MVYLTPKFPLIAPLSAFSSFCFRLVFALKFHYSLYVFFSYAAIQAPERCVFAQLINVGALLRKYPFDISPPPHPPHPHLHHDDDHHHHNNHHHHPHLHHHHHHTHPHHHHHHHPHPHHPHHHHHHHHHPHPHLHHHHHQYLVNYAPAFEMRK